MVQCGLVEWPKKQESDVIPARLIIFLRIKNWVKDRVLHQDGDFFPISGDGDYAIIESLIESIYTTPTNGHSLSNGRVPEGTANYLAHQGCQLIYWSCLETHPNKKDKKGDTRLRIVPTNSIESSCIAVPYDLKPSSDKIEWLLVPPITRWPEIFTEEMRVTIQASKGKT